MSLKNIQDVYRLSPRQRDLAVAHGRAGAGAPVALLHAAVRGALDDASLHRAAEELVRRHPALRTAFFLEGLKEPVQVVREKVELPIDREDWSDLSAGEQRSRLRERLRAEQRRPLDVTAAPLVRCTAVRLAPESHHFFFGHHPLVLDERSALSCLEELLALHRAFARGAEAAPVRVAPYREYIAWLEQQDLRQAESAFRDALHGSPGPTLLGEAPLVAEALGPPEAYLTQQISLSVEATGHVQAALRQHRLSLGALVEGAWAVLLAQRSGGGEVLFGAGVSGRPASLGNSEAAVGCFAGPLPRRIALPSPDSALLPWLTELKSDQERLRLRAHVSLGQLRAWTGSAPEAPLFESVLTVETALDDEARRPLHRSLGLHGVTYEATPSSPLAVRAELGPKLLLRFTYDPGRFDSPAIAGVAAHLAALIEAMATRPEAPLRTLPGAAPAPRRANGDARAEGLRFSPEDIEAILVQHPSVRAAAVTLEDRALVAHVVAARPAGEAARKLDFSLFYFADANAASDDKYRIYLEGARFADRHDFCAVWTPERHFHENGGLYPNPSILSAALATMTSRVKLRAGSVVVPIHHPLRVAEEWSVVDNLSNGRVGVSVASGWVPNDFAFAPENYSQRKEAMFRGIEQIRTLWAGGTIPARDGAGNDVALRVFPRPVQRELPMWLTAAGNPDTFEKAGELGFNVLTSLLAQSIEEAAEKIALYRAARARAGHDPQTGVVTMMIHTFLGDDADVVLEKVREPFTAYLRSHVGLMKTLVQSLDLPIDLNEPKWVDYLASFAFERYSRQGALLGTPTSCLPLIERLRAIGVDEAACLIDFGVDADSVIAAFTHLDELRRLVADDELLGRRVLAEYVAERLPEQTAELDLRWVDALPPRSIVPSLRDPR